jgi:membrane protein
MYTDTADRTVPDAPQPETSVRPQPRHRSLARETVSLCLRHRITGMSAEAAFWALLSLPPLALGTVGLLGYLHGALGPTRAAALERDLTDTAGQVLSAREVQHTIAPTLHSVLTSGHADVVSGGFLVALWSGSRALNVAIDTITVASGQSGRRGIVRTRVLSFALYLPALLLCAAAVLLLVAGPEMLSALVPAAAPLLAPLAWPALATALVVFVTTLYHLALPDRPRWRTGLPGALVALAVWAAGSALLRVYLRTGQNGPAGGAGFGRLAATAAILLWLYISALAVLVGAVFNAVRAGRSGPAVAGGPGKAVESDDGTGENKAETGPIPSPRMTRSSA